MGFGKGDVIVEEVKKSADNKGFDALNGKFVEKVPADGLSDKTDEDNFGFSYEQLDTYILTGYCEDESIKEKIDRRHAANLFKLQPMPEFEF